MKPPAPATIQSPGSPEKSSPDGGSAPGALGALTCWVVSDGKAGMEVQCLGLAEALGLDPTIKRIQVTRPWRWLLPRLIPHPLEHLGPKGDRLEPPWPDLLIASGRQTVAPSIAIRKLSGGRTFTVQVQNPAVDCALFDVVIAPEHDGLRARNVIASVGGLNRITPARLEEAAAQFAPRLAHIPKPRVAVMLGGPNKAFRMTEAGIGRLAGQLEHLARHEGAGLLISASRRTPPQAIEALRRALEGLPAAIWDGAGENPYLAYLALAEVIVVTEDSVNMASEAATTGKPVYIVPLEGRAAKFARFHQTLRARGISRPFEGRLDRWDYVPLRDTARAAEEIRRRLRDRGPAD